MSKTKRNPAELVSLVNKLEAEDSGIYRFYKEKSTYDGGNDPENVFYRCMGKQASAVSLQYFNTLAKVTKFPSVKNPLMDCVTMKESKLGSILADLLCSRNKNVEIWSREGSDKKWGICKKASPGDVRAVQELIAAHTDFSQRPNIMAISVSYDSNQQIIVGVATVDAVLKNLQFCQFLENDRFNNLEHVIMGCGPKEVFYFNDPNKKQEFKKISVVCQRANITMVNLKKMLFSQKKEESLKGLRWLIGDDVMNSNHGVLDSNNIGLRAMGALIQQLELLAEPNGKAKYTFEYMHTNRFMRLDASAHHALHLFPKGKSNATKTRDSKSLFGLLNRCRTAMGSRLLASWIKQPSIQKAEIERRLDFVQLFMDNADIREPLHADYLMKVPDIELVFKKIQRAAVNGKGGKLEDIWKLFVFTRYLQTFAEHLLGFEGEFAEILHEEFSQPISKMRKQLLNFQNLCQSVIDIDRVVKNRYYRARPDFDAEMADADQKMRTLERKMEIILEAAIQKAGVKPGQIKLERSRNNTMKGYFMRIVDKQKKNLKKIKDANVVQKKTSGVMFTTKGMQELSTEYLEIEKRYEQIQSEVVQQTVHITTTYEPVWKKAWRIFARLDVFVAFAHAAVNAPDEYTRPNIKAKDDPKREIKLIGARHPMMEAQSNVMFIPNDAVIEEGKSHFQIITGPNMGGKSTYIRTIGVLALMAQIGSFVPATEAVITISDAILARVGAGDNQVQGVSTFMAEMLEASAILNDATDKSLVIIDELGRGTSTFDGYGLATAIAEALTKAKTCCMFATHFHEVTSLSSTMSGIVNKHVDVQVTGKGDIAMAYKVKDGPSDRSFGIAVAKMANFPMEVIEMAQKKVAELEHYKNSKMSIA